MGEHYAVFRDGHRVSPVYPSRGQAEAWAKLNDLVSTHSGWVMLAVGVEVKRADPDA